MALTKVGPKFQVTIPKVAREAIGLTVGDLVEATPTKDGVLLRPKTVVDKHPEIDKQIAEGLEDLKKGRVSPAFSSARAAVRYLHRQAKKLDTNK